VIVIAWICVGVALVVGFVAGCAFMVKIGEIIATIEAAIARIPSPR